MNEFQKLDYNDDKKVSWEEIAEMGMNKRAEENLMIGIAWIGHTLDPHYTPHQKIIEETIMLQDESESEFS